MSKYEFLWEQLILLFKETNNDKKILSFEEAESLGKTKIDHSFLTAKKDLEKFGLKVQKISLKQKQIIFCKKRD